MITTMRVFLHDQYTSIKFQKATGYQCLADALLSAGEKDDAYSRLDYHQRFTLL